MNRNVKLFTTIIVLFLTTVSCGPPYRAPAEVEVHKGKISKIVNHAGKSRGWFSSGEEHKAYFEIIWQDGSQTILNGKLHTTINSEATHILYKQPRIWRIEYRLVMLTEGGRRQIALWEDDSDF